MKLYNSLTKQIEAFGPLNKEGVSIYSCGPTVYDHIHIGNLSAFIMADTLRRTLKLAEFENVHHVMNLTDVDDKTIRRSQEKYPDLPALEALQKLTEQYTKIFFTDMRAVGNDVEAYEFTKATDYVQHMQDLIRELLEKGFAYVADDGIYFSIAKYNASGKVYGQLVEITEDSTSEARIQNDEYDKDSAHDFALWKKQKGNEPAWDFDIDDQEMKGRPGWHIECSAMSVAKLGQPFDIHTGGVDLKFPHHENEIAQSTAGQQDSKLANFFVHNEHILVDGQKMSKSLNNFYTLQDIMDKGYDPLAFRLLVLQSHYRSQAHFSWENLTAAQNRLKRIRNVMEMRHQLTPQTDYAQTTSIDANLEDILEAMAEDLGIPGVLSAIESELDELEFNGILTGSMDNFTKWLKTVDFLLGLRLESSTPDISDEQKELITERERVRKEQNWTKADELRTQLTEQGIGINDTPRGPIWYRL